MNDFRRGDVVQLRSGGPPMTVLLRLGDEAVDCVWFNADLRIERNEFQTDILKQVPQPPELPRVDVRVPAKLREGGW